MSAENPVSPKAVAATAGAGIGAAASTLITWLLGVTVWDASSAAADASGAVAAVPAPVSGVIVLVVPAALSAIAGWKVTDPHRVTTSQLDTLKALDNR